MAKSATDLLTKLGIRNYTFRHQNIIAEFVVSGNKDAKQLLDKLGEWDQNDLAITERWLKD